MFLLTELPDKKTMEGFAKIYSDMNIVTTEMCLRVLKVGSVLLLQLEKYFAGKGLSQARFFALIILERESSKQQMPVEISRKMGTSKKNTLRLLDFMEKDGLISISDHKSDGRASIVKITAKGTRVLSAALPGYYKLINKMLQGLDQKSKEVLVELCDKLLLSWQGEASKGS